MPSAAFTTARRSTKKSLSTNRCVLSSVQIRTTDQDLTATTSQKEKEDLEEISTELELADEDELVPYKIGDSFMSVPLPEAQSLLEESSKEIEEDVSKLEETLSEIRDEMKELKAQLYARFGRSINLET